MELKAIIIALGIGSLAGTASGLFGIGGGVIIVPLLLYFFKYTQQTATATSLIALALPVGLLGIIKYYKSGYIQTEHIKLGLIISITMFVGAFIGAKLATQLSSTTLTKSFSIFLMIVAIRLFFTASK